MPIWVSDMTFFPQNDKIASCSRHGYVRLVLPIFVVVFASFYLDFLIITFQVRLYDPLLPQRRPIVNAHEPDEVFTCLSRTPNEK